jgi:hypothetical protein
LTCRPENRTIFLFFGMDAWNTTSFIEFLGQSADIFPTAGLYTHLWSMTTMKGKLKDPPWKKNNHQTFWKESGLIGSYVISQSIPWSKNIHLFIRSNRFIEGFDLMGTSE